MPQHVIAPLLALLISCSALFAEESADMLSREKRESSTIVGGVFQKIFSSKKEKRIRRNDSYKRNSLGTKESTFSVGLEFEPALISHYNFHHSLGINLLFGGSLDHYNKWLFFKMGTHMYDLSESDLLYGAIKDSTLFGFTMGFKYKTYNPRTVDNVIASYVVLEAETEAIIWEYKESMKSESGGSVKNDLVSNYSFGSGGGFTILNNSHVRADLYLTAGVRIYQERTMLLEDGSFEKYDNNPFDTDFYIRSGFTFWITREN